MQSSSFTMHRKPSQEIELCYWSQALSPMLALRKQSRTQFGNKIYCDIQKDRLGMMNPRIKYDKAAKFWAFQGQPIARRHQTLG